MKNVQLRPYQQEAREAILRTWAEGTQRTLLVLPTGCGKTVVFAAVAEECVRQGQRVLILAHRGELLQQAADKLMQLTGLRCAVEKAAESALGSPQPVTAASVQTLARRQRLEEFPHDAFDAVIIDEAHHSLTESYRRILRHFAAAKVLGVTATPDRGDGRPLSELFDSVAYEYTLPQAVREGYLAPIHAVTVPLALDLRGVTVQAGDFRAGDLHGALEPCLYRIAEEMKTYCQGRRTLVFLPLVRTSQRFCEILNENGFRAAEVNGSSTDRQQVLRAFSEGRCDVLCNAMLLTEGWDCPSVDCVVVLRPTKIRSLYCQMVGRGTRLCQSKKELLVLDFLWHTERHELIHPSDVFGRECQVGGASLPVAPAAEDEQTSCRDAKAAREGTLVERLDEVKHRAGRLIDVMQFELSIQDEALAHYRPVMAWEATPPSSAQLAALEKWGIRTDGIDCAGKASKLLDRLDKRRRAGLATPRQIHCLERFGYPQAGTMTFDEARTLIGRIAANGWEALRVRSLSEE